MVRVRSTLVLSSSTSAAWRSMAARKRPMVLDRHSSVFDRLSITVSGTGLLQPASHAQMRPLSSTLQALEDDMRTSEHHQHREAILQALMAWEQGGKSASNAIELCLEKGDTTLASYIATTVRVSPATYNAVFDALEENQEVTAASLVYQAAIKHGLDPSELSFEPDRAYTKMQGQLLHKFKEMRQKGRMPVREYNNVLESMLKMHGSGTVPEDVVGHITSSNIEEFFDLLTNDYRVIPRSTYTVLLACCNSMEELKVAVEAHLHTKYVGSKVVSDLVERFLHLQTVAQQQGKRAAGPDSWWLLSHLRRFTNAGTRIEGAPFMMLMQRFAENHLYRLQTTLYSYTGSGIRRKHRQKAEGSKYVSHDGVIMQSRNNTRLAPLKEQTLLAMLRLCGQERKRLLEQTKNAKVIRALQSPVAIRPVSKFAGQIWYDVERKYPKSHPSLKAHEELLQVACDRGDLLFMRQAIRLIEHRFPENQLDKIKLYTKLLQGCGVAYASADAVSEAIQYFSALPNEITRPSQLYDAIHSTSDYNHLNLVTNICWNRFQDDAERKDTLKSDLQQCIFDACKRIALSTIRKHRFKSTPLVLLPVPHVETLLLPNEALRSGDTAGRSIVWLPEKQNSYLYPPTARGRYLNEEDRETMNRIVYERRQSPLARTMIRAGLPPVGDDGQEISFSGGDYSFEEQTYKEEQAHQAEISHQEETTAETNHSSDYDDAHTFSVGLKMEDRVAIAFAGKSVQQFVGALRGNLDRVFVLERDSKDLRFRLQEENMDPSVGYTTIAETITELTRHRQKEKELERLEKVREKEAVAIN